MVDILGVGSTPQLNKAEQMKKSFMVLGWVGLSTTAKALGRLSGINITQEVQNGLDAEIKQQLSNLNISRVNNYSRWKLIESNNNRRVYTKHITGEYTLGSVNTNYGPINMGTLKIDVVEYLVQVGNDYGVVVIAIPEDYRRTFTLYPLDDMELTVNVQWELYDESLLDSAKNIVEVIR